MDEVKQNSYDPRQSFYAPEDGGIGDFSIINAEDGWHIYYLYREFGQENNLKPLASRGSDRKIGHAFSKDLSYWRTEKPVIHVDENRKFENLMVWAPAIIKHSDGIWYMFYTGVSEDRTQSTCVATSRDLYSWEKPLQVPAFIVNNDKWAKWSFEGNKDCRDPNIISHGKGYLIYYTSFSKASPERYNSIPVVAAAYSEDMLNWKDYGIVTEYKVWDKESSHWWGLESPCVFKRNNLYYLFWNIYETNHLCVFYKVSKDPLKFDGEVNLFSEYFCTFEIMKLGNDYDYFAAFTREYYGVLRIFKLDWIGNIPKIHLSNPIDELE